MIKLNNKRELIFVVSFLFILSGIYFISADTGFSYSPNVQYSQPGVYNSYSSSFAEEYWPLLGNKDECEATTDFVMFIQPGSCNPTVVRSDLLEEQNVPIFCKVDIIKLNPLIDVTKIKSVKFESNSGFGKYVAGVSFHPNNEAVFSREVFLDKPFINDVGYVVISLKRIPSEKDMPESIKVNLTGVLRFDMEGFFGSGNQNYYLGESSYEDWKLDYKENSAFKGAVYLKADAISSESATISLYKDQDTKLNTFNLNVGEEGETYYLPGFYCKAKVQVKLEGIVAGVNKVLLSVNDEEKWYVEGEKFLDNNCQIKKIINFEEKAVDIYCKGQGVERLNLGISSVDEKSSGNSETSSEELSNLEISDIAGKIYLKAGELQKDIEGLYGDIESKNGEIWNAKALYDLADLAKKVGMNSESREIFNKLATEYSGSSYGRGALERLEDFEVPTTTYNGDYIKILSIKGPDRENVNAQFEVRNGTTILDLDYDGKYQVGETFAEVFKILNLDEDKVELQYTPENTKSGKIERFSLSLSDREIIKAGYVIKLKSIKFEKVAKVSLTADSPDQYSESPFSFEIGIEKRAIQLSPETAQEMVDNLNKTIDDLNAIVEGLGSTVKTMKGVCLATSTALIAKNFFTSLGGGATARQEVMPKWYEKCKGEAGNDDNAFNKCLNNYNDQIEKDIDIYSEKVKEVNKQVIDIQKANTNPSGAVDRTKAANALRTELFKELENNQINFDVKTYSEGEDGTKTITLTKEQIDSASLTDLRDIKLNNEIRNSGASGVLINESNVNLEKIQSRLAGKVNLGGDEPLFAVGHENGFETKWINKVPAKFFARGENKGLVYTVPIPGSFETEDGKELTGFYALVDEGNWGRSGGYTSGADIKEFWIQSIGEDQTLDVSDDKKHLISMSNYERGVRSIFSLSEDESDRLVDEGIQAIKVANRNYGKSKFSLNGAEILVDKSAAEIEEKRCQDFMSPNDCWIMFNACDPVLCPSSRCDLGGRYKVDDVIQSGVIGSTLLCLPNAKEGIIVPVCLTGIHAGLDAYRSILQSYQDCLKENIETGRTVGICDEIHSIYLCEFFWRQAKPIIDVGAMTLIEKVNGQGMKGGGEYLTIQDAWEQASNSVDYMKTEYAENAYSAFKARSSGEIGTEFCKAFISASAPNEGNLDALLEPDSPVQFHAWFDEIKFSDATVPATSQYKVFYHIWAGRDYGASYQVYLKDPTESAYVNVQDAVVVDTGFVTKGGYYSETKDFTAPAGYKELCVRINGKDECGFGKVSTSFAVNYLSDQYYKDQLTDRVETKNACVGGSPSAYSLLTPNIQSGAQDVIDSSGALGSSGNLDKRGVVRVCSNDNPGIGVNEDRWQDVGYCDDESVKCWLDSTSVENVIKDKNLEQSIIQGDSISSEIDETIIDTQKSIEVFTNTRKEIKTLEDSLLKSSDISSDVTSLFNSVEAGSSSITIAKVVQDLDSVVNSKVGNSIKAEAVYLKFRIYYVLGKWEAVSYENELVEIKKEAGEIETDIRNYEEENNIVEPSDSETQDSQGDSNAETPSNNYVSDTSYHFVENNLENEKLANLLGYLKTNVVVKRECGCGEECSNYARSLNLVSTQKNLPDSILLLSMMMQESSCNKNLDEGSSCGLLQVSCDVDNWQTPSVNINAGAVELNNKLSFFKLSECSKNGECKHFTGSSKYCYENGEKRACETECREGVCYYEFYGCGTNGVNYYSRWNAAIRAYNGWGCDKNYPAQDFYVDEVMNRYIELKKLYSQINSPTTLV